MHELTVCVPAAMTVVAVRLQFESLDKLVVIDISSVHQCIHFCQAGAALLQ